MDKFLDNIALVCGETGRSYTYTYTYTILDRLRVSCANDHSKVGELCVSGPQVMMGYLHNKKVSREVLRHRWLHTWDLARWHRSGHVFIVDRATNVTKKSF